MALVKCNNCGYMISQYADSCPMCKAKNITGSTQTASTEVKVSQKVNNIFCAWGFILGLISGAFYWVSILLPISTITLSVIGLSQYKNDINKNKWMGVIGLTLGVLYLFQTIIKIVIA